VRRICQDNGLVVADKITAGFPGSSAVFIVDKQAVVKIFPPFLIGNCHLEIETYQLVDTRLDPYLPELLGHGMYQDQIDWPYLIMSFLPGEPIREVRGELSAENGSTIARELGWYIRRLHGTPLNEAKVLKVRKADWFHFLGQRRMRCLEELRDETTLSFPVLREIARLLATDIFLPPKDFRPLLLNGDFTEDHLLLEERLGEWRISGLIDWADALAGSADYEWVALWFGLCSQDVIMFREILKAYDSSLRLDNRFRQRMMAYTCIHRFGPEMIGQLLKQSGAPKINSLVDLQSWLWPPM
jgi:hygromycin-B 7''-O-kinase